MKKSIWMFTFLIVMAPSLYAQSLLIYAASSTINAMREIISIYEQKHSIRVQTSFASSGTLAKQIARGAPAHLFLSAHIDWMDDLEEKQLLASGSRFDLLTNQLVLITPLEQTINIKWQPDFDIINAFQGRFSMGDPSYVPAGKYAKEALSYFQWWKLLKSRIVATQNVRTALTFVEQREVEMGIVYKTDAMISKRVQIVGVFPEISHKPIVYPISRIANNEEDQNSVQAERFIKFLKTSDAIKIFRHYGFKTLR